MRQTCACLCSNYVESLGRASIPINQERIDRHLVRCKRLRQGVGLQRAHVELFALRILGVHNPRILHKRRVVLQVPEPSACGWFDSAGEVDDSATVAGEL